MGEYKYLDSYKDVIVSKLAILLIIDALLIVPSIVYKYQPNYLMVLIFVIINVVVVYLSLNSKKQLIVTIDSLTIVSKSKRTIIPFNEIKNLRFYYSNFVSEGGGISKGLGVCEIILLSGKKIEIIEGEIEDFDSFKLELSNLIFRG